MIPLIPQYTVSELVNSIKTILEGAFYYIKITGEISTFKVATSGHIYFNLKDNDAMINIVLFKNSQNSNIILEDGLNILIYGKLTIYKDRSNYQIIAEKIEINGVGELIKIIENRKIKLESEGLFDKKYKKQIPKNIKNVGIITAPNGAAIKDIESRLKERMPLNQVILYPSLVQGQGADLNIIDGIKYFNNLKDIDVIIITRGGGSLEDLMCFNSEILAREVFKSKIPIISAIGHEIDWTIIDYVADLRLPTPTAVGEFLSPLKSTINDKIDYIFKKILKTSYKIYNNLENKIEYIIKSIYTSIIENYNKKFTRLHILSLKFDKFDRTKILKQGYAVIRKNGKVIVSKSQLNIGDILLIELADGIVETIVK